MKALVLAEHANAASEIAGGARTLADEVVVVAIGKLSLAPHIADTIVHIGLSEGTLFDDAWATVISIFDAHRPSLVLVEPTRRMKSISGRLAAYAHTSVITNVSFFEEEGVRNLYLGGLAQRTQRPLGQVGIYTVLAGVFNGSEASGDNLEEEAVWVCPGTGIELVATEQRTLGGNDLSKEEIVVAVGRGFSDKSELDLARELCKKLPAGMACSRPLTERPVCLPHETYVGVSGLMLSPRIYIACGISGQMQHMVGCKSANTIFAINKDKNAPIFSQCDYGLVGDVKSLLPALVRLL